jgi:hypothetical protein
MNLTNDKRVVVEMTFVPKERYLPVLESIRRNVRISVDRLRARLTDSEAHLEMELSGDAGAIDDFIRHFRGRLSAPVAVA